MSARKRSFAPLEAAALELKDLPYDQLRRLPEQLLAYAEGDDWRKYKEIVIDGESVQIDVLIAEWGLLRRRISVELVGNNASGSISPATGACIYFERFRSGRVVEPRLTMMGVLLTLVAVLGIIVTLILVS